MQKTSVNEKCESVCGPCQKPWRRNLGFRYNAGAGRFRQTGKDKAPLVLLYAAACCLRFCTLAKPIAVVYGIDPEFQALAAECLRIGCVAFPALAFLTVVTAYLPAVDRVKSANRLVLVQHGLTIVPAVFGCTLGLQAFFASYVGAVFAAASILVVFLVRDRFWFMPERNPETILEYSILLKPEQISAVSADASERLACLSYPSSFCSKAALVVEDCLSFVAQHNSNAETYADIGFKRCEDGVFPRGRPGACRHKQPVSARVPGESPHF